TALHGGDEVVGIIPPEKLKGRPEEVKKAIDGYKEDMRKALSDAANRWGISRNSPLFEALTDLNAHGGVVEVKQARDGRTFQLREEQGRPVAEPRKGLNGALVDMEVEPGFDALEKREGGKEDVRGLRAFVSDVLKSKPESSLRQLKIDERMQAVPDAY